MTKEITQKYNIIRKYQKIIDRHTSEELERKKEPIYEFIIGSVLGLITFFALKLIETFLG